MKIFMEVHATHPTFLSLIFRSSPQFAVVISVEREKNWNQSPVFNNTPILDISSDRDTNPDVQFFLQTLNTANPETQHFPLQECPYGHLFLFGSVILIPKYSFFWEITLSALKSLKTCVEAETLPTVTHLWKTKPKHGFHTMKLSGKAATGMIWPQTMIIPNRLVWHWKSKK